MTDTARPAKALLFCSYGTTHDDQRGATDAIAASLRAAFPDRALVQAFTSSKVRRVLERRGEPVPGPDEALDALAARGVTDVLVQPGHLVDGLAFQVLVDAVQMHVGVFRSIALGAPLLSSVDDVWAVADALAARFLARPGAAVVLMGHGADQTAGLPYAAMNFRFRELGRPDVLVGSMRGRPDLDEVMSVLGGMVPAPRRVVLAPLMLTAGGHAGKDMAGTSPASWRGRLEAAGYEVEPVLAGISELEEVRGLYAAHARAALEG